MILPMKILITCFITYVVCSFIYHNKDGGNMFGETISTAVAAVGLTAFTGTLISLFWMVWAS